MPSLRPLVLSLLAASLAAQNERPPEAFQIAVGLQQRGLHDEAARHFADFVKAQPGHALAAEACYRLGLARIEGKQVDEAVAALQQALQKGGEGFKLRPECRYRLGNLFEQQGKHADACQQFAAMASEVAADHYLLAAARYGEGEAWREQKDDAKAALAFAAAAEAATGERANYKFPALYQLGFAQSRSGQQAEAAASFALAAQAAGDDGQKGECFYLSGDALLRLKEFDAAERALKRAVKLGGEFGDDAAYGLGFVALGRGDRKAAVAAFGGVLERFAASPLAASARLERGRALYQDQQAAKAQEELQPLLAEGVPEAVRAQAQELLGLCALATGAGEEAVLALQKALANAAPADRPRLSFALGEALANTNRHQEAIAAYAAVPKDAPAELRGDALYGECFALHALGQHQESIVRAQALLALQPPHRLAGDAQLALAENQFALQQYEAADAAYAALGEQSPHAGTAAWKRAWCTYLRGDKAAAATRFGQVAATKDSPHAEEALSMQALASLEGGEADAALQLADRYRARFKDGAFVDRTERTAARVLRQKGDFAGAQQRLARAAAVSKQRGDASLQGDLLEQAELAYQQGDYKAADAAFAQLVAAPDATGARALAGRAWCAFELGDDAACRQALVAAKQHPAVAGELAGVLELESALAHRQKDWPAAIAAAQQFAQQCAQSPKLPALQYALGTAQARAGDAKAARTTLAALAQQGGYERMDRVQYELGWACRRQGDEPAALAAFALVAKSDDAELAGEAKLHLGVAALDGKDLAQAQVLLAAVTGSQQARAFYRLAFAEFEAAGADGKQLGPCRDRFLQVAAMPGELALEARYMAAECCHRLGDPRGACEHGQQLLQQDPQHARAQRTRLLLGECAVAANQPKLAVPALEQFLRGEGQERTDLARANLWLGRARMALQDHAAAEANLQKVTELSDGELAAEAQFRIGENRAAHGDLRGAADAFVKLPILYGQPEWVRRGLLQAGLTYERLQQPDKAQRFFRELLDKHQDSAEAKTAGEHVRPN